MTGGSSQAPRVRCCSMNFKCREKWELGAREDWRYAEMRARCGRGSSQGTSSQMLQRGIWLQGEVGAGRPGGLALR